MKTSFRLISIPLTVVLVAAIALLWGGWRYANEPLDGFADPLDIQVPSGSSLHRVAGELAAAGVLDHPRLFVWLGRMQDKADIRAGEYRLHPGMSRQQILERMHRGEVLMHRLTVVEGWQFRDLRAALEVHEAVENTLTGESIEAVMAALGHADEHPEGRFFPDTYTFSRGTTDLAILRQAYERMEQTLNQVWSERQEGLPFDTAYEALILASLIEKETGAPHERRQIAGVFVRRLEQGMRLQTDPTTVYGMDDFSGVVRPRHLRRDHPWNTYTRGGLPPTPIALPGEASLRAAVDPKPGDSLYFVSRGDGTHHFSATLQEHNRAIDRYLRGNRNRGETPEETDGDT